jgi:hypothetical protein
MPSVLVFVQITYISKIFLWPMPLHMYISLSHLNAQTMHFKSRMHNSIAIFGVNLHSPLFAAFVLQRFYGKERKHSWCQQKRVFFLRPVLNLLTQV